LLCGKDDGVGIAAPHIDAPELDWFQQPFVQSGCFGAAHCTVTLCHSGTVCRKLSDGRSLVRTSTVEKTQSTVNQREPSTLAGNKQALNASRQSTLRPCESCPTVTFTHSAAVKASKHMTSMVTDSRNTWSGQLVQRLTHAKNAVNSDCCVYSDCDDSHPALNQHDSQQTLLEIPSRNRAEMQCDLLPPSSHSVTS